MQAYHDRSSPVQQNQAGFSIRTDCISPIGPRGHHTAPTCLPTAGFAYGYSPSGSAAASYTAHGFTPPLQLQPGAERMYMIPTSMEEISNIGLDRLEKFLRALSSTRPETSDFSYWSDITRLFFSKDSVMRQGVWHPAVRELRTFNVVYENLARYFEKLYLTGVNRIYATQHSLYESGIKIGPYIIDCPQFSLMYNYGSGSKIVLHGHLRVVFSSTFLIDAWEFNSFSWQEFIDRNLVNQHISSSIARYFPTTEDATRKCDTPEEFRSYGQTALPSPESQTGGYRGKRSFSEQSDVSDMTHIPEYLEKCINSRIVKDDTRWLPGGSHASLPAVPAVQQQPPPAPVTGKRDRKRSRADRKAAEAEESLKSPNVRRDTMHILPPPFLNEFGIHRDTMRFYEVGGWHCIVFCRIKRLISVDDSDCRNNISCTRAFGSYH